MADRNPHGGAVGIQPFNGVSDVGLICNVSDLGVPLPDQDPLATLIQALYASWKPPA